MKPFEEKVSADIIGENVAKLKELFPEAFTEGKIDFEVLKQVLGGMVDEREEKYGLNWHGKRRARQLALTPSTGTLRPFPTDSVDWDTTKNLMIEGDNLEVLKLLQKSYAGKVKLIYIDPPYNTGNDFVYPDDFTDNIKNYQILTGQVDAEGNKLSANTESSGRFHTDWLNMMYPRLKLARNLLRDDGVIFISIDDCEFSSLKKVCDDTFGEENFIEAFVWIKKTNPPNNVVIGSVHEYVLAYAKSKEIVALNLLPRTAEVNAKYINLDNDARGPWMSGDLTAAAKGGRETPSLMYEFENPHTGEKHSPPPGRMWIVPKDRMLININENRIWWGENNTGKPKYKRFLSEVRDGFAVSTLLDDVGNNGTASKALNEVFDGEVVFQTPKPVEMLSRFIQIATASNSMDICVDFYAGSGTTGHAVMMKNVADGGNRRYILVQLPEKLDPENKDQKVASEFCDKLGKPRNIAELTKERLRRAAKKIKEENPLFSGDLGFRVFKLDSTNILEWDPAVSNLEAGIQGNIDHLKTDRTEDDILYELLLKLGLDLAIPLEQKNISGKTVYSIGAGTLIACLATAISEKDVESLALGLIAWHKEQAPAGDTTIVFRDSAFVNDIAKTNMTAILAQHEILEQDSSKYDKKFRFIVRSI